MQLEWQWDADTDASISNFEAGEMEYEVLHTWLVVLKNTEATGFTGDVNVVLPACAAGDTGTDCL